MCCAIGLSLRTIERWQQDREGVDRRRGPKSSPGNKLTAAERERVIAVACSPEFRDLSPKQIVPRMLDRGEYVASESSMYRILRSIDGMKHRRTSMPPAQRPRELVSTDKNEVWTWDITYLPSFVRGRFFYLYAVLDLFSRKIVAWRVEERESSDLAAALFDEACAREGVARGQLTLHADNGPSQRSGTLHALLEALGVARSFSRPAHSNDNPFVESLFATFKGRPHSRPLRFATVEEARVHVDTFVRWYNEQHLHSSIGFVTPSDRHEGRHRAILEQRRRVLEAARAGHPERWTEGIRTLDPIDSVVLNPAA